MCGSRWSEIARAIRSPPHARATAADWRLHITLRLTSPQAAIVLSSAASIAFSVAFRFDLMTP